MVFNIVLIFGLWDGECHLAKTVTVAAIGLSKSKDSPEENQYILQKMYILQYWSVQHWLFWYVHHFQNGNRVEHNLGMSHDNAFQTQSMWKVFLLPILNTQWGIYFILHKTLSKLFTSQVDFIKLFIKNILRGCDFSYNMKIYILSGDQVQFLELGIITGIFFLRSIALLSW